MNKTICAISALALGAVVAGGQARADLITNGGFEETTGGTSGQIGQNGFDMDGWSLAGTPGYIFVFNSGTGDITGSGGQYGTVSLWGPNNGAANGLPAASPAGGNYIAMDSDFQVTGLQQTLTGLTPGEEIAVSFYYGFAQQYGFTGPTTQDIAVSLGDETQDVLDTSYSLPSEGFSGWQLATLDFTADSTSEVLSFLAFGSPQLPPFALLDGVSANAVPEPASLALLAVGAAGIAGVYFRGRRAKAAA